jgi:hypothetical protein
MAGTGVLRVLPISILANSNLFHNRLRVAWIVQHRFLTALSGTSTAEVRRSAREIAENSCF